MSKITGRGKASAIDGTCPHKREIVVKVDSICKSFGGEEDDMLPGIFGSKERFHAVKDVTFDVGRGEVFGILGPNGCGKSTLIRMLSTLIIPEKGKAEIFGKCIEKDSDEVKNLIGRVSVDAAFFKRMSAYENLMYAGRIYGLDAETIDRNSREILEEIGFAMEKYKESIQRFSRGMQQKIAITRGFLTRPSLLLLDEPTTGLDPKSKLDVQKVITEVRKKEDITIILTSHDMEEIERLCDNIAIMDKGKIIAMGSAKELKELIQKNCVYDIETNDAHEAAKRIEKIEGVVNVKPDGSKVKVETMSNIMPALIRQLSGLDIQKLDTVKPTLEDVFIHLTGKQFSEAEVENKKD